MNVDSKRYSRVSLSVFRAFITTFAALWLTGLIWVIIQFTKTGPRELHTSTQTFLMKAHGALSFLALISIGSFASHVKQGFSVNVNKRSGLSILICMTTLIITAWLLYYASSDTIRSLSSSIHLYLGVCLPVLLLGHGAIGRKLMKTRRIQKAAETKSL